MKDGGGKSCQEAGECRTAKEAWASDGLMGLMLVISEGAG